MIRAGLKAMFAAIFVLMKGGDVELGRTKRGWLRGTLLDEWNMQGPKLKAAHTTSVVKLC
jgi:hypothetical protein